MADFTIDDAEDAASLGTPDDGRVWYVPVPGGQYAERPLSKHPSASATFGLDATQPLGGSTVASATASVSPSGPTVGTPQPNSATFTNRRQDTVAIGKGVLFAISGGIADEEYEITLTITTSTGEVIPVVCTLRVKA